MVEVIRWYQIWLIEFVLDVSWVMLTKLLGVYCVGVYYWNIGVYVLIYIILTIRHVLILNIQARCGLIFHCVKLFTPKLMSSEKND